jgi:Flp pilus assembly protein TadB
VRLRGRRWIRWALAAGAGAAAWLLTGWPALTVGVAGAVIGLPAIAGAGSRAEAQIDRVEAVEEWARRVADVVAIGVGLEQALLTAARTAPAAISGEAATLAARIAARTPTEQALRRFADELADPTADLVVAALILAARRRGPGVAVALTAIAESVGEEVAARRRVEADRAKPRATARAVTAITVLIIGMGLLNRGYTDPYGTAVGQVVLIATLGFFAAALWWMHSMTTTTAPARILAPVGEAER